MPDFNLFKPRLLNPVENPANFNLAGMANANTPVNNNTPSSISPTILQDRPHPATDAYKAFLDEQPPERVKPSKMSRIGAILSGVGEGLNKGPLAGYEASQKILDAPNRRNMEDYANRGGRLEAGYNVENKDQAEELARTRLILEDERARAKAIADANYRKDRNQFSQQRLEQGERRLSKPNTPRTNMGVSSLTGYPYVNTYENGKLTTQFGDTKVNSSALDVENRYATRDSRRATIRETDEYRRANIAAEQQFNRDMDRYRRDSSNASANYARDSYAHFIVIRDNPELIDDFDKGTGVPKTDEARAAYNAARNSLTLPTPVKGTVTKPGSNTKTDAQKAQELIDKYSK